mmetsp:Transcript_5865/g.8502  ORF Transcript_5865/g.8502 Transcript_5865/m.8502 type:complete len:119 (-) Transcript_5865:132-488(-)
MQSTWCSYPFLTRESSMEMEYCNSDLWLDLERAKAYWKVLSGLGLVVHLEDSSSRREWGGVDRESFSSSWRRTERCFDLVVLILLLYILFLFLFDDWVFCFILFFVAVDLQLYLLLMR